MQQKFVIFRSLTSSHYLITFQKYINAYVLGIKSSFRLLDIVEENGGDSDMSNNNHRLRHDIQHDDTQHNDIQHNGLNYDTQHNENNQLDENLQLPYFIFFTMKMMLKYSLHTIRGG